MAGLVAGAFRDENLPDVVWYPITKSSFLGTDIYNCDLPYKVGKLKNVIYAFRDNGAPEGDRYLVGETDGEAAKRLQNYLSGCKIAKAQESAICPEIRARTDQVFFAVIEQIAPGVSSADREIFWIDKLRAHTHGYNQNRGGGGGTTKTASKVVAIAKDALMLTTPDKYRKAVQVKRGSREHLKFVFSPEAPVINCVYVIRVKCKVGDKEIFQKYIGRTIDARQRGPRHVSNAFSLGSLSNKPLSKAIRANPNDVEIGILATHQPDMGETEKHFIETKVPVLNNDNGGGGSYARNYPFAPKTRTRLFVSSMR